MAQQRIDSAMSVAGHPIHPTMIHFPVAMLLAATASDAAYIFTGDFFWARASVWLVGIGALGGWAAGLVGTIELLLVRAIRRLVTAWNHAVLAVVTLSLATFNWMLRIDDPALLVNPWGIYMSLLTTAMILLTSMQGGQLVYEYAVGVNIESEPEPNRP
ncbi:MAG: DUF2231 domain-containing protein [Cellvibrionaceae bacterium]